MLRFSGSGVSDVGLVRAGNEDAAFVGPYVSLVADGVGGAAAGEVASATTAYVVSALALRRPGDNPVAVVHDGVAAARTSLQHGVLQDVARAGMASTLSVVVCDGRRAVLGHVGDSRAYLVRDGELRQLSHDHTYVQRLVDGGQLRRHEVPQHPWRNVVLRTVDANPEADLHDLDVLDLGIRAGDRLLLCSDGLTDLVADDRIARVLALREPGAAASVLVQSALAAGGRDNVTCVVLDVVDGPRVVGDGRLLGALADPGNVVDPATVRVAVPQPTSPSR
jgi:protein phosphatase